MYDVACFFYSVTRKKHMSWVSVRGNRKISARVGKEWFYFFAWCPWKSGMAQMWRLQMSALQKADDARWPRDAKCSVFGDPQDGKRGCHARSGRSISARLDLQRKLRYPYTGSVVWGLQLTLMLVWYQDGRWSRTADGAVQRRRAVRPARRVTTSLKLPGTTWRTANTKYQI